MGKFADLYTASVASSNVRQIQPSEQKKTAADQYLNLYFQTNAQRFDLAIKLADTEAAQSFAVAQMLEKSIENIDRQLTELQKIKEDYAKGNKTSADKAFERELSVEKARMDDIQSSYSRQMKAYTDIVDGYDISQYQPQIVNAADAFGNSLGTAGTIESKVKRYVSQVAVPPGSDAAKAAAASIYGTFRSDAYSKGYQNSFDAKDNDIRNIIATQLGVNPNVSIKNPDGTTATISIFNGGVDVDKEERANAAAARFGQQTLSDKRYKELIAKATGADGKVDKEKLDELAKQEANLGTIAEQEKLLMERLKIAEEKKFKALDAASLTGEEKLQRAREIYRGGMKLLDEPARQALEYDSYFKSLSPELQQITLGYNAVSPNEISFMKTGETGDDPVKEQAYSYYNNKKKERDEGKQLEANLHIIANDSFPEDDEAQKKFIGYVLRATELEKPQKVSEEVANANTLAVTGQKAPTEGQRLSDLLFQRFKMDKQKQQPQGEDLSGLPPIEGEAPVIKTEDEVPVSEPGIINPPIYRFGGMDYEVSPIKDTQGITTGYNLFSPSTGDIQKIDSAEYIGQGKQKVVTDLETLVRQNYPME